jgi:hypothetical protein
MSESTVAAARSATAVRTVLSDLGARALRHPHGVLLGVCGLLYLPLLFARLWLIDDHETLRLLAAWSERGWSGVAAFLQGVDFGDSPRFRPLYYLLRVLESFAWRDTAGAWFALRGLLLAGFLLALLRFARSFLPPAAALLLVLAIPAMPWAPDAFMRLGPQESYAAGLCGLLILALQRRPRAWLAASVLAALLVATKENFLVLLPLQLVPLVLAWRRRDRPALLAAAALLAASGAVALVIALKLLHTHGVDFYGNSVQGERLQAALRSLVAGPAGWASLALVAGVAWVWQAQRRGALAGPPAALWLLPAGVACLLFNLVFYGGVPELTIRYAFPYWVVWLLLAAYGARVMLLRHRPAPGLARAAALVGLLALGFGLARNLDRNLLYTFRTWEQMQGIEALAATDARTPILVHAWRARDFEPATSVGRFLDYYQRPRSPRYLVLPPDGFGDAPFETFLFRSLQRQRDEGAEGFAPPPPHLPGPGDCVEAYFQLEAPPLCNRRVLVAY